MFCVIQEIEKKKSNKHGYSKRLESHYVKMSMSGQDLSYFTYNYSYEKFKRNIQKAYRISIHESFRQNGKIKKRQLVIGTVDYYDLADGFFCFPDFEFKITMASEKFKCSEREIYELVEKKLKPLQERITEEFMKTEEFKIHEEHRKIIDLHESRKSEFNSKYNLSGKEYDRCFDVFGNLQKPDELEKIKAEYEAREKYKEESRRYQKEYWNNYKWDSSGSYSNLESNTYDLDEKKILKQFYRELSKKYHPDSNINAVKILNKLKQDWGL